MYEIPGSSLDPISSLKLMLTKLLLDCEALFHTPLTKFSKAAEKIVQRFVFKRDFS